MSKARMNQLDSRAVGRAAGSHRIEAPPGNFQGMGIAIEADQDAVGTDPLADQNRVPGGAEGAVDDDMPRRESEEFNSLVRKNRCMRPRSSVVS